MVEVSFFLGAGASKPFGYPTTKDFMENFRKARISQNQKSIFNGILEGDKIKDIEHVLEFLDAVVNFQNNDLVKSIYSKNTMVINMQNKSFGFDQFVTLCSGLKERIVQSVYKEYQADPTKIKEIRIAYDELFEAVSFVFPQKEFIIYTINYDKVIEQFTAEDNRLTLVDGFTYDENKRRKYWNHEQEFSKRDNNEMYVKLFKIHGSLDWRITQGNEIVCVDTEELCPDSKVFKSNLVIYPAQKSYDKEEPFKTLYGYFRNNITNSDIVIIIGYSFRDPPINEIIANFVKKPHKHIIVLSPSAESNLKTNFLPFIEGQITAGQTKRIHPLNLLFGPIETFHELSNKLGEIGS